jgi:aspartate carbamoyltransferase catalytic subunit/aspartate carbamoyltransferase regulatory subunit
LIGVNVEDAMRMDLIDINNVRSFRGRDFLRVTDFSRDELVYILEVARVIARDTRKNRHDLSKSRFYNIGAGKQGATTFFEPSTRTHDSSVVAMTKLGMRVPILRRSTEGTSQKKSESLAHDLFMYATYGIHAIVMRHPQEGAPQWAADYLESMSKFHDKVRPVIVNGGDGAHCHPTQAMLDALAYYLLYFVDEDGKDIPLQGINRNNFLSGITLYGIGDSLKGRTIKDNARLLAKFKDNELVLVGPSQIRLPEQDRKELERSGLKVTVLEDIPSAIEHARQKQMPVFYFMRVQEERLDPKIVESVRGKVIIDKKMLEEAGVFVSANGDGAKTFKRNIPFFHPLPMHKEHREIHPQLESTKHFKCFEEAEMGPYVRAAIIGLTTGIIETSAQQKYVDLRLKKDCQKYREINTDEEEDNNSTLLNNLLNTVESDEGRFIFQNFVGLLKKGEPPKTVFADFIENIGKESNFNRYRHLTFRFVTGEEGTVIDHIENGLTGLIKFQLDISKLIGRKGCDGKPILVSAVDGLESSKYGLKGVIKVRGHLIPPEALHYCYLLSRSEMTLSHIKNGRVVAKFTPTLPEILTDFITCKNPLCISRQEFGERIPTTFYRSHGESYKCRYCDTIVERSEIRSLLIKRG